MCDSPDYSTRGDQRSTRDRSRSRSYEDRKYRRDSRERRNGGSGEQRTRRDDYDSRHRRRRSPNERARRDDNDRGQRSNGKSQRHYSPRSENRKRSRDAGRSRSPLPRSRTALPSQNESFRGEVGTPAGEQPEKQKPNFKPTGLLAKEANTVVGTTTVLKYHEPPEARKPPPHQQWRMYVFKGEDLVDTVHLFQRSCWLIGRDQHVTDLFVEHGSISKQHAVIQFRFSSTTNEYGDKINKVKPYLIDLESANGTKLNDKPVEVSRFVELVDGDVVTFGDSEREYVMMLPKPDKK